MSSVRVEYDADAGFDTATHADAFAIPVDGAHGARLDVLRPGSALLIASYAAGTWRRFELLDIDDEQSGDGSHADQQRGRLTSL